MDEEFEPPTMSFESYLNYDQPLKKKKKIVKTSATAFEEKGLQNKDSKSSSEKLDLVQELCRVNENKSEKGQASGAHLAKLEKVPTGCISSVASPPLTQSTGHLPSTSCL